MPTLGPCFKFPRSLEVRTFALPVPWSVERLYLPKSGASGLQGSVFTLEISSSDVRGFSLRGLCPAHGMVIKSCKEVVVVPLPEWHSSMACIKSHHACASSLVQL